MTDQADHHHRHTDQKTHRAGGSHVPSESKDQRRNEEFTSGDIQQTADKPDDRAEEETRSDLAWRRTVVDVTGS